MIARSIAVTTHGRYLVELPAAGPSLGLVVGFHGYAESAEVALGRLQTIGGTAQWTLAAIQGLHRFYRGRSTDVVASWMTRQDRELAIEDNTAYVAAVVDAVRQESAAGSRLVFAGFSQGVAMAFRAACASTAPVSGVVAVGGDVPPELSAGQLSRLSGALLARGDADALYTRAQWEADQGRLRAARVDVTPLAFDGGHEWHTDVTHAAATWLETMSSGAAR